MRCLRPIYVKDTAFYWTNSRMQVPCGKCYACRMNQRTEWTVRNLLELQTCAWALFVTLTYDDDHIPVSDNGLFCVSKHDVQTWLKRFRKWLKKESYGNVRYFITSEYGEGLKRPHYHCLLYFDSFFSRDLKLFDEIEFSWAKGQVKFGDVEPASVHYCMKYLMKFDEEIDPLPEGVDPPFRLMSRRPALGVPWLDDSKLDYYRVKIQNDQTCKVAIEGRELNLPRFLQSKCAKLPWNVKRSVDFHYKTYLADEAKDLQDYSIYLNSVSEPLPYAEWEINFPRCQRTDQLNTLYKDAYIKHLREHLIKF